MQSRVFSSVFIGSSLAVASVASAQTTPPIYFRAETGYSWSRDVHLRDRDFGATPAICGDAACTSAGSIDDSGSTWLLGGAVGYRLIRNVRAELALDYRHKYEIGQTLANANTITANVTNWSLFANGYYDFNLGYPARPYVGGGVGWAHNRLSDFNSNSLVGGAPSGSHDAFAWSVGAGVAYPVNDRMSVDVGYRYVDLGRVESDAGTATLTGVAAPYTGASGKLKVNELVVGLRW